MQQFWERRYPLLDLTADHAARLLRPVFPRARVVALEPLAGGLRNSLYRVSIADRAEPVVLRLYSADPTACAREAAIARLLDEDVPRPVLLHAEPAADPPYAVLGWCDGVGFTDLLAAGDVDAIASAARSAGAILARIQRHTFAAAGELGANLAIVAPLPDAGIGLAAAIEQAAQRERVRRQLGEPLTDRLIRLVRSRAGAIEDTGHAPVLVHADYKPENLLVREEADGWRVAAVLDWEFAIAGSRLFDPGLFQRRAPWLPPGYATAFAEAFVAGSDPLPPDWRERARLTDLVNLLDFLDLPEDRPALFADVRALVAATVDALG